MVKGFGMSSRLWNFRVRAMIFEDRVVGIFPSSEDGCKLIENTWHVPRGKFCSFGFWI